MSVIGFLAIASRDTFGFLIEAFHRGLGETGYVEDKNVAVEYCWADNNVDRLLTLATDWSAEWHTRRSTQGFQFSWHWADNVAIAVLRLLIIGQQSQFCGALCCCV